MIKIQVTCTDAVIISGATFRRTKTLRWTYLSNLYPRCWAQWRLVQTHFSYGSTWNCSRVCDTSVCMLLWVHLSLLSLKLRSQLSLISDRQSSGELNRTNNVFRAHHLSDGRSHKGRENWGGEKKNLWPAANPSFVSRSSILSVPLYLALPQSGQQSPSATGDKWSSQGGGGQLTASCATLLMTATLKDT